MSALRREKLVLWKIARHEAALPFPGLDETARETLDAIKSLQLAAPDQTAMLEALQGVRTDMSQHRTAAALDQTAMLEALRGLRQDRERVSPHCTIH